MEERHCGRSDLQLSVFGLGTMTFGAESDEATSHRILDTYYESGGRFIDTADVYSQGTSEEIIGRWLNDREPEGVIVGTKARFAMGDSAEDRGASRAYLTRALDASLGRLDVDVIDLYQVHAWDPDTPIDETLQALDEFVTAGKVRHIGVSNYSGWQLERAVQISLHHGWAPIISMQPQYNLLAREIEWDVVPVCLEHEIGVLPWSPLGGGWLTGKYSPDERPAGESRLGEDPGRGVEAYDLRNNERTWEVVAAVREAAERHGVSMSQVALNWVRNRPEVTSVLLGCRTVAQLEDNLGALAWNLDEDEMDKLTRASAPGMPTYPHGFLESLAGLDVWENLGTRADPVL